MLYPLDHKMLKPGLRTRLIFIQVQVRVQPILASPSSSSSSETLFFRVQVRVRSLDTCAVFVGRHDINKTVKDMHLCGCYEKRNLNLPGLINNKYFTTNF